LKCNRSIVFTDRPRRNVINIDQQYGDRAKSRRTGGLSDISSCTALILTRCEERSERRKLVTVEPIEHDPRPRLKLAVRELTRAHFYGRLSKMLEDENPWDREARKRMCRHIEDLATAKCRTAFHVEVRRSRVTAAHNRH
jgi:hypothetical protein